MGFFSKGLKNEFETVVVNRPSVFKPLNYTHFFVDAVRLFVWGTVQAFSFLSSGGEFEPLEITALSSPPELPDVMKPQDSSSAHTQEQTAS